MLSGPEVVGDLGGSVSMPVLLQAFLGAPGHRGWIYEGISVPAPIAPAWR